MNANKDENMLRLDIAYRGVIIGEPRVVSKEPVVVGLLEDDTQGEIVRLHDLFRYSKEGYRLCLTRHIVGRLTDGQAKVPPCVLPDFSDVKEFMRDKKPDKTGVWEVPLGPNARGKIQIGDFTILFHFIQPTDPVLN